MNICRLCVRASQDFRSLYHESGGANELYEMTLEYFHPKIVNLEEAKHLTGVCLECVGHMHDFHNFQSAIMMAQLKLIEDLKEVTLKTEEGEADENVGRVQEFISLPVKEEVGTEDDFELDGIRKATGGSNVAPPFQIYKVTTIVENECTTQSDEDNDDETNVNQDDSSHRFGHVTKRKNESKSLVIKKIVPSDSESTESEDEMPLQRYVAKLKDKQTKDIVGESIQNEDSHNEDNESFQNDWGTLTYETIKTEPETITTGNISRADDNPHPSGFSEMVSYYDEYKSEMSSDHKKPYDTLVAADSENIADSSHSFEGTLRKNLEHSEDAESTSNVKSTKCFPCQLCGNSYAHKRSLAYHIEWMHRKRCADSDKRFKCDLCESSYLAKVDLQCHMKTQHPDAGKLKASQRRLLDNLSTLDLEYDDTTKLFKCKLCDNGYSFKSSALRHINSQHKKHTVTDTVASTSLPGKRFQCNFCLSSYTCEGNLKTHIKREHSTESQQDAGKSDLIDHDERNPVKRFKCKLCGNTFALKQQLSKHIGWKHKQGTDADSQKRYKCMLCGSSYKCKSHLRRHMRTQHPEVPAVVEPEPVFACNLCDTVYKVEGALVRHKERVHGEAAQTLSKLNHGTAKKFPCNLCDKTFVTKCGLARHMASQHTERPDISHKLEYDYDATTKLFKCRICGNSYKYKNMLILHMTRQHWKTYRKKPAQYACKKCSKNLTSKQGLKSHDDRCHGTSGVYSCTECDKTFNKHPLLIRHRWYVHKLQPQHKCETCGETFKSPSRLQEHLRKHTKENMVHRLSPDDTAETCTQDSSNKGSDSEGENDGMVEMDEP